MKKSVAIIGGGLAGITAALRLAKNDFKVHLYEKNSTLGGKMNEQIKDGFRFDTGPSLLTMPFVVDELFQYLGLNRKDHLSFKAIDPICKYLWPDGTMLNAHTDYDKMIEAIKNISSYDAEKYKSFLAYSETIYKITADVFLFTAVHELKKLANFDTLHKLFSIGKIDPFRTVHQGIQRFFSDPHVVQVFDRYATYNGSNPFEAPATLNIIPYVEYVLGSFYIQGGMYRLIEKFESLCKKYHVEIHKETAVEKIIHKNGKIKSLQINNEKMDFDYVVCNADVVSSFEDLIDGFESKKKKLQRLEPSLSGIVFLWGVKQNNSMLEHHNIFFSENYEKEFRSLFSKKSAPDDMTIYVSVTGKSDPQHAPDNCENWFVLCNMPYLNEDNSWNGSAEKIRKNILEKLTRFGLDIKSQIVHESILTPQDFYNIYKSNKGSIYGISSNSRMTAFRRPANRNREIN
jgi:phytoene desaturase